eukprot:jgi/Orpsp1_1/1177892/evm.model.c7180000063232.1
MDLVGPLPESIHKNKYFFTLLDDYSRFGWVLFLKSKSDTFSTFHKWFINIKNRYNTRIKYIRSDNGTEFCNKNFRDFCDTYGIVHQFTVPYNPQQNGKAERFNGTLISSAKAMLSDSMLSRHFWEDAIDTSNYLHNRLPHRGINNIIPYERLNRTKVDYSNIRVFGCKVYYFIPKSFRTKFQNNASPGIFLGYTENPTGYKILDITTNKIILSRNVEFFETNPGDFFTKHCNPTTSNFIPYHEIRGNNTNFYFINDTYTQNIISNNPASTIVPITNNKDNKTNKNQTNIQSNTQNHHNINHNDTVNNEFNKIIKNTNQKQYTNTIQ